MFQELSFPLFNWWGENTIRIEMFSTRPFIVRYSQLFSTVLMSYRIFIKLFNLNIYFPRCSFLQQLFGIPLFIEHESVFSDCDHHDGLGMKWSGSVGAGAGERRGT